jgi:L-threonylcarbamoyladenylate synthase
MENLKKYVEVIKKGGVGVIAAGTVWTLIGNIFSKKAVKKVYHLKKRKAKKPLIVLISDIKELKKLNIFSKKEEIDILKKIWPSRISIILPQKSTKKLKHTYIKNNTLLIRLPQKRIIRELIKKTGPIFSTSANIHKKPVAKNISEVRKYFGDNLDFIIPSKTKRKNLASSIISIDFKKRIIKILRKGEDFEKILKLKKLGFKIESI